MTWNVENIKRNHFILFQYANHYNVELIFLSEPQIYQCDINEIMDQYGDEYVFFLNSEDINDLTLPFTCPRAKGGTMIIWKKHLSPFIKVIDSRTPHFVFVLLSIP